jgi:hypothetical protein
VFAVIAQRVRLRVEQIAAEKARGETVWPVIDYADIAAGTVTSDQLARLRQRGCLVVRGHFDRDQALGWDRDIVDYVESNRFFETYRGPGDDFFGSVGSRPEIYPIYWSPAQMQARQGDRMARIQGFLNAQWTNQTDGVQWFDPRRDSLYPDRIRRRPEGADSAGLGAHLDPGTLDLWMTRGHQQAFRHLFDGTVEAYDPWDAAHPHHWPPVPRIHDVLGLPHLPGLDRAVGHGPRPGRAPHRPDPRGHGLSPAAAAAARCGRRRHVRGHDQSGVSRQRNLAPAAHEGAHRHP